MGFQELGDKDGTLPEVEGGEVSGEGRAVEEVDGGIVEEVAVNIKELQFPVEPILYTNSTVHFICHADMPR